MKQISHHSWKCAPLISCIPSFAKEKKWKSCFQNSFPSALIWTYKASENPFRQPWHLQSSFWRVQFPGEGGWTPPGSCLQRRKGIRIFASIMLSIWDFNKSLSSFILYCFFQCHSSVIFFPPLSFPLHFNASVLKGVFANWALKLQGTTSPESFPPGVCWTCRLVYNTPKLKQSARHPTLTLPA